MGLLYDAARPPVFFTHRYVTDSFSCQQEEIYVPFLVIA